MTHDREKKYRQYLFYLHAQIVEGTDGNPRSPRHGVYEYFEIIETFSNLGFHVISEIRPINCNVNAYARKLTGEIESLLASGVPAENITVVGASKGGMIAATVSHLLENPQIRYVILAGLFPALHEKGGVRLHGEVLSIHDKADKFPIRPELFFNDSPGLTRSKTVITETGLGHGILYRPYPIWTEEVLSWIGFHRNAQDDIQPELSGNRY
ncbi:MAG: alpha/beta hydrolase [Deltaproteobacteria bacterium]|nr:alpha/beta hydrolase [Deltaproteobacteria bacterium]